MKEIDKETFKLAIENAYMEGQKQGLLDGKIHSLYSLRINMEKMGWDEVPLKMIRDLEDHLKKEKKA